MVQVASKRMERSHSSVQIQLQDKRSVIKELGFMLPWVLALSIKMSSVEFYPPVLGLYNVVVDVIYVYNCCTEVITSKMAYYFVQLIYFYSI